ncbi:MAG: poly-gamma-glutamate hydrolase family protein [Solirubrobacterales bacterium]|nr:poly-gamma-glutamate hydrolase family protein [Solirubrobacterales bacterium]
MENRTSRPLNAVAHAAEHCTLDAGSIELLGGAVGEQLLVHRSPRRRALYTIVQDIPAQAPEVQVGRAGATRLQARDPRLDVLLETSFVAPDGDTSATRLTEHVLGDAGATGIAILAPHGGDIEVGTADQAHMVYEILARAGARPRAWSARGYDPAGAYGCWHITSSEICERSFPKLGSLFLGDTGRGPFAHAIAFHGHGGDAIVIGGGLPKDPGHLARKRRMQSSIRRALELVTDDVPAIEVKLDGPLSGRDARNIVNRVTVAGNGVQLEQPLAVRQDRLLQTAIAHAVGSFYAELL